MITNQTKAAAEFGIEIADDNAAYLRGDRRVLVVDTPIRSKWAAIKAAERLAPGSIVLSYWKIGTYWDRDGKKIEPPAEGIK